MKENKVSPLGGCLPMVLQIPVFFGFYRMIQSAIELRGASFLWVCDLSKSDTLFFLPGLNWPVNPLPLLMGVTMLPRLPQHRHTHEQRQRVYRPVEVRHVVFPPGPQLAGKPAAAAHGCDDVVAGAADPRLARRRSCPAKDDEVHAVDVF